MVEVVLRIPAHIMIVARAISERTDCTVEEVLVGWLEQAALNLPVSQLPDDEVMILIDEKQSPEKQKRLDELASAHRETQLTGKPLDELYRLADEANRVNWRKAEALAIARSRGLVQQSDAVSGGLHPPKDLE